MSKVVFGQPILAERKIKDSDKFTGRFYAEKANNGGVLRKFCEDR